MPLDAHTPCPMCREEVRLLFANAWAVVRAFDGGDTALYEEIAGLLEGQPVFRKLLPLVAGLSQAVLVTKDMFEAHYENQLHSHSTELAAVRGAALAHPPATAHLGLRLVPREREP